MTQTDGTDGEAAPPEAGRSAPLARRDRIVSLDVLRGTALLGILLLNIIVFAQPGAAIFDPRIDGADEGVDLAVFMGVEILFEGAFRAIFSMLFGAGLLVFVMKPDLAPGLARGLYYRRTLLLIGFGLVNAYLFVWWGDILYYYGVAGLLLYFFRNLSPRGLAAAGGAALLFLLLIHTAAHIGDRQMRALVEPVKALPAGAELTAEQREIMEEWRAYRESQYATPEALERELRARRSGYVENFRHTASVNVVNQTAGLALFGLWDALAMMLLGMALMKWRVLDASRSMRFYLGMAAAGLGVGLPLNAWETFTYVDSGFQGHWVTIARPTYDIGRLALALGYIGLVMALCKTGLLARLRAALADAGRMALTNYLAQSVICNFIFMGFGLGLFGMLARHQLYYVVLGVWLFQLAASSLWMRRFRFGPAEWLWRSLTYMKRQPMRL